MKCTSSLTVYSEQEFSCTLVFLGFFMLTTVTQWKADAAFQSHTECAILLQMLYSSCSSGYNQETLVAWEKKKLHISKFWIKNKIYVYR